MDAAWWSLASTSSAGINSVESVNVGETTGKLTGMVWPLSTKETLNCTALKLDSSMETPAAWIRSSVSGWEVTLEMKEPVNTFTGTLEGVP